MGAPRIIGSSGAVAWSGRSGGNYDPPQGAYAVWEAPIPGWPGYTTVKTYPYPKSKGSS